MSQQARIKELEQELEVKRLELEIAEAERPRLSMDDLEVTIRERIDELMLERLGKPAPAQKKRTLPAPPKK